MRTGNGNSAGLCAFALGLLLASPLAPQANPPVKGAARPAITVIQGVLAGSDGVALHEDALTLQLTAIFAIPVTKDEEQSASVTVTAEAMNRFSAHPDEQGRFVLRIKRAEVPQGQKMRLLLLMPVGGGGLQSLKKNDANILIDIATAPASVNLGKIVIGSGRPG